MVTQLENNPDLLANICITASAQKAIDNLTGMLSMLPLDSPV